MKESPLVKGKNQVHHEVDVTRQNQAIGQTKDLLLIKYVFRSYGLTLRKVDEKGEKTQLRV